MMKYIKKYSITIICALLFLLACKSCQSCSRARQIDYNQMEYVANLDSLDSINRSLQGQLVTAEDSIKVLNTEINALKEMKGVMQSSLDNAHRTNRSLVNSIRNK